MTTRGPAYDLDYARGTPAGGATAIATASKANGLLTLELRTAPRGTSDGFGYASVDILELGPPSAAGVLFMSANVLCNVSWHVGSFMSGAVATGKVTLTVESIPPGQKQQADIDLFHGSAWWAWRDGGNFVRPLLVSLMMQVDPAHTYEASAVLTGSVFAFQGRLPFAEASASATIDATVNAFVYNMP